MRLEIYEKYTREKLDMVRMVKYARYNEVFNGIGQFELKLPFTDESVKYLVEGNYVLFDDDVLGVIKFRDKETSESTEVTIRGYLINKILEYRSFLLTKKYSGKVANVAANMVNDLIINSEDQRRNISFIELNETIPDSPNVEMQVTGDKLNVAIENMLSTIGYGYKLKPIISSYEQTGTNISALRFYVIKPSDRTIGNEEGNTPVVFSIGMNNLTSMSYQEDATDYCSTAIVAGQGEGTQRITDEVGDTECSGIDRIELYVDARDLQSDVVDTKYRNTLKQRGLERLSNYKKYISVVGNVIADGNNSYVYGENFHNGDYVTIIDEQLGLQYNLQITEITKTLTEQGEEKFDISFGSERISVQEMVKRGGILNG